MLNNAAASGDVELFNHLVARGADPHKSMALHYVSKIKDPEKAVAMLSNLLDKHNMNIHADTDDLRDFFHDAQDSGTPLCTAVWRKNLTVVEELLRRGAHPDAGGATGDSAVSKAVGGLMFEGFLPALQPLLDAGADPTRALVSAASTGKLDIAKDCLQYGADPKPGKCARMIEEWRLQALAQDSPGKSEKQIEADEAKERRSHEMIEFLQTWQEKSA